MSCWICEPQGAPGTDICARCRQSILAPSEQAWHTLAAHLHANWRTIRTRGSFDLSAPFRGEIETQSLNVHLHFVGLLGAKLKADVVAVDLHGFSQALLGQRAHPEVTLLLADSTVPGGKFVSYDSEVSVLRQGDEVHSAMWTFLSHPLAVKVCYLKAGAPVREPEGFPWHPTRQRKIVKLSPYKGDTRPLVARRDLRI